jgi:iron complex transport system substrate-binding protein
VKQIILSVVMSLGALNVAQAQAPQHVASANLCADQLLMSLADEAQIASLSPLSRDATISYFAARAERLPVNRASGEDLIRADADLVLIGPYDSRYTRSVLEMQHIRTAVLEPWTNLDEGRRQILDLARELHQEARGVALVDAIDAALSRLPHVGAGKPPSFLALHRRGFVSHAGLTSELLARAGLRDASRDFGIGAYGFISLESLVRQPPDFLVVDEADGDPEDNGQAFLVHPALMKLWPMDKRIVAPGRWTICGGPSTPPLIDAIAREIKTKVLGRAKP